MSNFSLYYAIMYGEMKNEEEVLFFYSRFIDCRIYVQSR